MPTRSPAAGCACCGRRCPISRAEPTSDPTYAARVDSTAAVCSVCGATEEQQPLTWTVQSVRGRTALVCEACTRRHLRAMEAQLDEEHW